jgi:hypothetical protein
LTERAVSSYKVIKAALGGCTHFITCPSDDEGETMTIGFGQGVVSALVYMGTMLTSSAIRR